MEENTSEEVSELKNDDKKSIYDVLNMEGNDELKFGLLISLIKLKQVSDRDVVNGILNLVSYIHTFIYTILILNIFNYFI